MNCNIELHDEISCSFCGKKLEDVSVKHESCCDIVDKINNNGMKICQSCGSVHGFDFANENIDFTRICIR